MPRSRRNIIASAPYHVLNRSNGRFSIFGSDDSYRKFCRLLDLAAAKYEMCIVAFCIMPNHWHMILRPNDAKQLSRFMFWLCNTHTRRYHVAHETVGQGPLYQGRYKAMLLADDRQLCTALRYVERNALTAKLTTSAAAWPWCSASAVGQRLVNLNFEPCQMAADWQQSLDAPMTASELDKSVT